MCQQTVQFCAGSTKPLIFAGSLLTLSLAIAIGYLGCSSHALYNDISPSIAKEKSLAYYLQLLAAAYLVLITLFGTFAAHYDQKHSIRALSLITSLNFIFAVAAIVMVPTGSDLDHLFADRLNEGRSLYDFKDRPVVAITPNGTLANLEGTVLNVTDKQRTTRMATDSSSASANTNTNGQAALATKEKEALNSTIATKMWDRLQMRGCCGFLNATVEWRRDSLPKTCCDNATQKADGDWLCDSIDEGHNRPCISVIGSASLHLLIVLALIALVNLYLATVTGVSTYRTFHYNEASQNAYT